MSDGQLPTTVRSPRRRDIQGLRAIAVALVVVFHSGVALPGGFVGVDVFFAISGFVITATLLTELEQTGRISFRRFYLRRVKRLLPALAVLVAFVVIAGTVAAPAVAARTSAYTGFFASFFSANLYLVSLPTGYFATSTQLDPLLHTWTLAVEEQFYFVFPALLLAAWMIGRRWSRPRLVAVLMLALVADASFYFTTHVVGANGGGVGYYGSPARAWEFATGALIALSVPIWRRLPTLPAALLVPIGLTGIGIAALAARPDTQTGPVVAVLSTACLLGAGCSSNRASALVGLSPLTWLGDRSYSLYLWHWPLIVFAGALLPGARWAAPGAAAVSVAPAWLSYRYVENPVRHNTTIRGRRALALAAACTLIPALYSLEASRIPTFAGPGWLHLHADVRAKCDSWAPYGSSARNRCTWNVSHPRGTVVLIGDSNAGHFTEPFISAARASGYTATVASPSGCPFVQLQISDSLRDYSVCNQFNRHALHTLIRQRPNLLVIATRTDVYLTRSDFTFDGANGQQAHTETGRARLWLTTLREELVTLNNAGIPVVVVEPVPLMPGALTDCAVIRYITNNCGASTSRAEADRELSASAQIDRAAIRGRHAWLVNFEDNLCGHDRCYARRNGLILYRDAEHLSVLGAETLTGAFTTEVLPHARGWRSTRRESPTAGKRFKLAT